MKKRILSMLLVVCMLMSMLPGGICGRCFGQQPAGSAGRNRQCKRWRYDHADWQH